MEIKNFFGGKNSMRSRYEDELNAIIDKAESAVEKLLQQYESKHSKQEFVDAFARIRRGNLKHFKRLRRDIEE